MTALAAAKQVRIRNAANKHIAEYPVVASEIIYKGALVSTDAAGYLIAGANTAGHKAVGVAEETRDNSGGSSGDLNCKVASGLSILAVATSITQAMVGDAMYLVDDQTVDDKAGASAGIPCGELEEFVSTTSGWVFVPPGGGMQLAQGDGLNVTLVAGGAAGAHVVTGIAPGDEIVFVGHFSTAAAIATLADLTSEFTVSAADAIDNTGGTATTSDQLMVIWRARR